MLFRSVNLCRSIVELPGIRDLSLTTNGVLLADMADELRAAGVRRVNISLDSLNPAKFAEITRGGDLERVLLGIRRALEAGLHPVKLNVVLIGGFNDSEIADFVGLTMFYPIEVRFIELMPIGEGASYWQSGYLPNSAVLDAVPELLPELVQAKGGVARLYAVPGAPGRVGLINPISGHFCAECNRLRLTADGKLRPCLHSDTEISVRGLHRKELEDAILAAVEAKPRRRQDLSGESPSEAGRGMSQIGG